MKRIKQAVLSITIFTFGFSAVENSSAKVESPITQDTTVAVPEVVSLFETFELSMLSGLNSDNKNLIDSNLYHLVMFKTDYPEFQSEAIAEVLTKISKEGSSHHIRYKAHLTLKYFQNQENFNNQTRLKTLIDNNEVTKIFFHLDREVRAGNFTDSSI